MADFHPVALLDLIAFLATLVTLVFLWKGRKGVFLRETKVLFIALMLFTLAYNLCLFLEWSGLAEAHEILENFIGALIPMWWAFVIYAFLQEISQQELRNSEARYQDLYNNAPDMFVSVDAATAKIIQCNRMLETVTGYSREEILGRPVWDLYPVELHGIIREAFETFRTTGEVKNVELQLQRQDGSTVYVILNASAVRDKQGRILQSRSVLRDITEQKRAEEQLRLLSSAVEQSSEGVAVVDLNGNLRFTNEAFASMHGYQPEELIGKHLSIFHTSEQIPIVEAANRQIQETGQFSGEIWHTRRDGSVFPSWMSNTLLRDEEGNPTAMLGTLRDITERKQAEQALKENEIKYRTLFESGADGFFLMTDIFLDCNEQACRIWECNREDVIGHSPTEFSPEYQPDGRLSIEAARERIEAALDGEPQYFYWKHKTKSGKLIDTEVSLNKIILDQKPHLQAIVRDITKQKKAEQEREKLIAELEAKNAELERFTYTVSHDLKSPLITTKGFVGMLKQDLAEGNQDLIAEDMQRISHATETMERLLDELLELSRIGRIVNPPERVAFSELVEEALALLAGEPNIKNIRFEIDPNLPIVQGDRIRLREVLQNLIENSIKFMEGQPEPRIEIGARQDEEENVFFIRDNGVGIEPRYHEKIFGLFDKLNSAAAGTGIGLAIVKRIVEVHGGRIWVESQGIGHGSTFCFTLPAKPKGETAS